jgi:hypothetical protein
MSEASTSNEQNPICGRAFSVGGKSGPAAERKRNASGGLPSNAYSGTGSLVAVKKVFDGNSLSWIYG